MVRATLKKYKSLSLFTFSSFFLNLSNLASGLVTFHWIDPYHIGLWQGLMLIDTYSAFFRLGIINGMNRELPFAMGQGNMTLAVKYAETTLFFTVGNILVFIMFSMVAIFFIPWTTALLFPVAAIFIVVSVNFYNSYLYGTFRANADFDQLSIIQIIQGFLKIFSIALVVYLGFNGFLIREISIVLIITLFAHIKRPLKQVIPKFEKKIFLELLKVGLPIFAGSYMLLFLNTVPRLLLLRFGTVAMLGIYAPLVTIIMAISALPDSITTFLYPRMTYQIGKTKDIKAVWKKTLFSHAGLFFLGIPIVIICYFGVPLVIDHFMPKYAESKSIIKLGVFTALFMSYKFGYTTLITVKAWKQVIIYIGCFAALQLTIPLILMRFYPILVAVTIGQMGSAFFMVIVSLSTNYSATHKKDIKLLC